MSAQATNAITNVVQAASKIPHDEPLTVAALMPVFWQVLASCVVIMILLVIAVYQLKVANPIKKNEKTIEDHNTLFKELKSSIDETTNLKDLIIEMVRNGNTVNESIKNQLSDLAKAKVDHDKELKALNSFMDSSRESLITLPKDIISIAEDVSKLEDRHSKETQAIYNTLQSIAARLETLADKNSDNLRKIEVIQSEMRSALTSIERLDFQRKA